MLVWAVIVGVAGAFATSAFRLGIDEMQRLFGGDHSNFVEMATRLPWPVRVALPTAGGLIAGLCLLIARRRSAGQAECRLHGSRDHWRWRRAGLAKPVAQYFVAVHHRERRFYRA